MIFELCSLDVDAAENALQQVLLLVFKALDDGTLAVELVNDLRVVNL